MSADKTTSGVPIAEATAKDFIMVRAALVRRLGGANEALVWARIYYRSDDDSRAAHEVDETLWWRASYDVIADETGLTSKQARSSVEKLVDDGFVERVLHSGRIYSYRAVVLGLPVGADSQDALSAQEGRYMRPAGQIHLPQGALTPSTRQEDLKDIVDELFEQFWKAYPRHVAKAAAKTKFVKLAKDKTDLRAIVAGAVKYSNDPNLPELQYVPHPTTWLNQGRWEDDALPQRDRPAARNDVEPENEWMRTRA